MKSLSKLTKNKALPKVVLILILVAIISVISYISNLNSKSSTANSSKSQKQAGDNDKVLDCAKKIAVNSDLLNGSKNTTDCIFQGCGDFFQ